jgi:hypothetical protein
MVKAGEMAIGWRHETRVDERGIRWYGSRERECVVLSVGLGWARVEWCADGTRTAKPVSELRPEAAA